MAYPASQYNIYRSYTPGGPYFFVHSVDGSTYTWTDDGAYNPTGQRAPIYYNPGSPSNWYAAFLHQNSTTSPATGISINGLAYGFPYDDQGSNAPNINAAMTSVAINLNSWLNSQTPPPVNDPNPSTGPIVTGRPYSPASLQWITEPLAGRVNDYTTLQVKAVGAHGNPFFGGTEITVNVIGVQGGTYTVRTDEVTGIGVLSFKNTKIGFNYIQAILENSNSYNSKIYQVVAKSVPLRLMPIFDRVDNTLSNTGFYRVVDDINRNRR
ncbi:MAG: hypothetical protein K8T25_06880 [Planctomycetia bacterium]|nr:hypothetical protein [Planctomycetia bacterium]